MHIEKKFQNIHHFHIHTKELIFKVVCS